MNHHRRLAGIALAVLLAGCATTHALPPPPPPDLTMPDLRGTWSGLWSGTPVRLLVIDQKDAEGTSGVYVGSYQVLGERAPSLHGVMTSTIQGSAVSTSVNGWFGYSNGALTLVVRGATSDGIQQLTLRPVEGGLAGIGESSFRWGPQGTVTLSRRSD